MPELPEVETTRRGIAAHLEGQRIRAAIVRQPQLRWPVPARLHSRLRGRRVAAVDRRGKYLLLRLDRECLIVHLGMSGALRLLTDKREVGRHDHWDLVFDRGVVLRFTDPRRFGSLHLTEHPESHPLLSSLGPEPLGDEFSGAYLYTISRKRQVAVKHLLMNSRIVVGVGNIYVCEALHQAGIHPLRAAGRISLLRYEALAAAVKRVLGEAIEQGGTTLRDFFNADGAPGYFSVRLQVYGRAGEPCLRCGNVVKRTAQGQRGTWHCPGCQH